MSDLRTNVTVCDIVRNPGKINEKEIKYTHEHKIKISHSDTTNKKQGFLTHPPSVRGVKVNPNIKITYNIRRKDSYSTEEIRRKDKKYRKIQPEKIHPHPPIQCQCSINVFP